MAIEEVLVLKDEVTATAEAAAAATRNYAVAQKQAQAATENLSRAAAQLAVAQKSTDSHAIFIAQDAYAAAEKEAHEATQEAEKFRRVLNKSNLAASKAKQALKDAFDRKPVQQVNTSFIESSSSLGVVNDKLAAGGRLLGRFGPTAIAAAAGIFGAVKAGQALYAVIKKVLGATDEAVQSQQDMRMALDQATKGKGVEAYEHLRETADSLGKSTKDVVTQFLDFRKKGLDNIQSEKLVKLRADLEAAGVEAGVANKAIEKTVAAMKAGKGTDAAIQNTAKAFGVAGDGANAAAQKALTMKGALENLKNFMENFWERVATLAGPALNEAGAAITEFLNSAEGSDTISAVITGIAGAIKALPAIIKTVGKGIEAFLTAAKPGIEVIKSAFSALGEAINSTGSEMTAAQAIGKALGTVFSAIAEGIARFVGSVAVAIQIVDSIGGAISSFIGAVKGIPGKVSEAATGIGKAAAAIGTGFVKAIKGAVSAAIKAGGELAQAAINAIKAKLGIKSPSKVAMAMGENVGTAFNDSLASAMPDSIAAPTLANDNGQPFSGGSVSGASTASAGGVTVNVHVTQTNASVEDIEAATMRGVEEGLRMAGVA